MTLGRRLRPVLVGLAVLGGGMLTASCGDTSVEGARFESLAQQVAEIDLGAQQKAEGSPARPHRLQVQVMDPHDLWDARDGGLRGLIERTSIRTAEAAAPVVAEAVVQQASSQIANRLAPTAVLPAVVVEAADPMEPEVESAPATLQLGAFSSPDAARAAWQAIASGQASQAVKGLSPRYETVQVNGRTLTRLRIAAPTNQAGAICQAVASSDPWCARRA